MCDINNSLEPYISNNRVEVYGCFNLMASRVRQERGELLMRVATSLTSYYMRLRRKMREFCKGDQSKTTLLVVSVVMLKYTGEKKAIISCIIMSPKSG